MKIETLFAAASLNLVENIDTPNGGFLFGRSGFQDSVLSLDKHQQKMDDADTQLERGDEPIRHCL